MKALLILAAGIFLACNVGKASALSPQEPARDTVKMKKLIRQLEKEKVYAAGDQGPLQASDDFRRFSEAGSAYDFLKMAMEHKNPLIRLYALRAVAEKMDDLPAELVLKFMKDTTAVAVQYRDGIREVPVSQIANGFLK